MNKTINSTEVRKNWSEYIDSVIRDKPLFIKRRRDVLTLLSIDQLMHILENLKLNLNVFLEDDGSYSGSLDEIDIVCNAETIDELVKKMSNELIEYSENYMDNFHMYYNSPNRRSHFPYVYKVITHKTELANISNIFNINDKIQ